MCESFLCYNNKNVEISVFLLIFEAYGGKMFVLETFGKSKRPEIKYEKNTYY